MANASHTAVDLAPYLAWLKDRGITFPKPRVATAQDPSSAMEHTAVSSAPQVTRAVVFLNDVDAHQITSGPYANLGEQSETLMRRIQEAMGLSADDVTMLNCYSAPDKVDETPGALERERELLHATLSQLSPRIIICLGNIAAQAIRGVPSKFQDVCGKWFELNGRHVLVTFNPRDLLRHPPYKRDTWSHLQQAMEKVRAGKVSPHA